MTMNENHYKVSLHDIAVVVKVGIASWEQHPDKRQLLMVDLDLYQKQAKPFVGKAIDDCINYLDAYKYITETWPQKPHTDLLETLLEELVSVCFKDQKVNACRVVIKKPHVFNGQATPSVEFYRVRT